MRCRDARYLPAASSGRYSRFASCKEAPLEQRTGCWELAPIENHRVAFDDPTMSPDILGQAQDQYLEASQGSRFVI